MPTDRPPPPPPRVGSIAAPSPEADRKRLGDLLVDEGLVDRERAEIMAQDAHKTHRRIGELFVERGLVDETEVYRALAFQRGLTFATVDRLATALDPHLVDAVPRAFLDRQGVVPIARDAARVVLATSDPNADVDTVLKAFSARTAMLYLVTPTDVRRLWMLIDVQRGRRADTSTPTHDATADLLASDPREAHYVSLFETLLLEAIAERASDIHIERYGEHVRVRLRVDGDLHDVDRLNLTVGELLGLVNVVKINANLDIAEKRLPQGGRMRRRAGGRAFDLRVQTQPSLHGEHVVIRLLPQDSRLLAIEDLGFPADLAREYRRLLDSPSGLVLVVGPTGSGKSTTLYAGLQHIARDATRKMITVEDPIEYAVIGVQQTQVRPELGFSFAHAMRAFVREDPDVILVGEIRDGETALEAIRASQTGHVVLSTLHCNDATDAVQRLLDLGMHPNSIASELLAVIAQRLARRICDGCREATEPNAAIVAEMFPNGLPVDFRCYRGRGCERCGGHGTHGRIAVIEYLRSDPNVRRAISRTVPVDELRATAHRAGLVTMRTSALSMVTQGVVPLEELPWLLPAERMAGDGA